MRERQREGGVRGREEGREGRLETHVSRQDLFSEKNTINIHRLPVKSLDTEEALHPVRGVTLHHG